MVPRLHGLIGFEALGIRCRALGLRRLCLGFGIFGTIWEFPKIGNSNIEPKIVGSLV